MVDLLETVTKEMQGLVHEDFRLESSLRESPVVIPEPVLRLSPAFAEWLRRSAAYDIDVTARNPGAEPDEEGIKPLSRFTLKVFGWKRSDDRIALWLAYPIPASTEKRIETTSSDLVKAIWSAIGVIDCRHSGHQGAAMRMLFPVPAVGDDEDFDLYKALEEDELAEGKRMKKFPIHKAMKLAVAHSGAVVAACDEHIVFMYGNDFDELDSLKIRFKRTSHFHIAQSPDVNSIAEFCNLVGQRQLEWLRYTGEG